MKTFINNDNSDDNSDNDRKEQFSFRGDEQA